MACLWLRLCLGRALPRGLFRPFQFKGRTRGGCMRAGWLAGGSRRYTSSLVVRWRALSSQCVDNPFPGFLDPLHFLY